MRAPGTSPGCVALFVPWLEVADRVPLRFLIGRYFFVASRIDELLCLPCLPFLRPKLARLCCELIAHKVELMRHGQIKALPCELVTPVGLLMKETRVFNPSSSPRHPRTRNASSNCS